MHDGTECFMNTAAQWLCHCGAFRARLLRHPPDALKVCHYLDQAASIPLSPA
jgi:hypothetical protein